MTPEHWGMLGVALTVLGGLIKIVAGVTKIQVVVDRMAVDMKENTKTTNETGNKVASVDSRVSRIEGQLGIGA